MFTDNGPSAFWTDLDIFAFLALFNSSPARLLTAIGNGSSEAEAGGGANSYEIGIVENVVVPVLDQSTTQKLRALSVAIVESKRLLDSFLPESRLFRRAPISLGSGWQVSNFRDLIADTLHEKLQLSDRIRDLAAEVDMICEDVYGFEPQEVADILQRISPSNDEEPDEEETLSSIDAQEERLVCATIDWIFGCTLGRWDIRLAIDVSLVPQLGAAFDPLPASSPATLLDSLGQPATKEDIVSDEWLRIRHSNVEVLTKDVSYLIRFDDAIYPLAIAWDGILVDDPGHPQDVIGRIREVLGVIWGERADAVYEEATQILAGGGHDLRPWFRQSFFDEHIKRYSKSRRKAPIYWRLATPSNSYALWLYYHRFSRDTLYKALEGYVKPKVQYEERQADTLRAEAGGNPTASQRRAIEAQEAFVEELRTFRDEIERVAPLWNPDLNDGVIINFAPLWRLTPRPRGWQKECRDTWTKLARGDYDWAHLAMHLWPERVVPKCREDRSLAIAHGLDHQFWLEGENGKWQPRHVSDATLAALIAERTSVAVQDALAQLQDAPAEVVATKRAVKQERPAGRAKKGRKGEGDQQATLELGAIN